MSSVDTRVVEMQFDNKAFGSGVKSSLNDLDSLKKGLKLEGATSGLDEVSKAASKVDLATPIGNQVEEVKHKIDVMRIFAVTAIATMSHQIFNAAESMTKSLTIAPVTSGFQEYEGMMGSIQTMLANTSRYGTQLPEITADLDQLNTYADQTIYSFSDMTKNIGLFTNAGIRIGDATSMIKGFSNEAAASGTSAEGASSAAYQLSQALSSGKITLMDWRSLTNVGMGNKNMQDGIINIANAMGTFKGKGTTAAAAQKDFNKTLEKGWLTTDVMSNYLKIMAGDMTAAQMKTIGLTDAQIKQMQAQQQMSKDAATKVRTFSQLIGTVREAVGSGWTDTFRTVFGDFNEATTLFTGINNVVSQMVSNSASARNKMLGDWKALGGRTALIDGLKNAWAALSGVLGPVRDAFRDIFPAKTGQDLYNITVAFRDFMAKLIPSGKTMNNIARTFDGFFSVIHIGVSLVKAFGKFIFDLIGHFSKGSGGILDFTARIGDFLTRLNQAITQGDVFNKFFGVLERVIEKPIDKLKQFVGFIASFVGSLHMMNGASSVLGNIKKNFDEMSSFGDKLAQGGGAIKAVFSAVWKTVEPILSAMGRGLKTAAGAIKDFLSGLSFNDLLGVGATGGILGIAFTLKKLVDTIKGLFKPSEEKKPGLFDKIKESLDQLSETLKTMQQTLKAATILEIAAAILILTIAVNTLSKIDAAGLTRAVSAIGVMIAELVGGMKLMDKALKDSKGLKLDIMAAGLILLAIAIDVLASAAQKMAILSWNELAKGLVGVAGLLVAVAGAMKLMPTQSKMISNALGILIIAEAIKVLVTAVQDISTMSWGEIAKGLAGVAALLISLGLYNKFSNASSIGDGAGILLMAAAIKVLASAMKDISGLSWPDIAKGLTVTAVGLGLMAGALKVLPKDNVFQAASIVIMAASLKVLASAVGDMGKLSWKDIVKGLVGIGGGLALMTAALRLMPESSMFQAAALVVVAAALKVLASAMTDMGKMSWNSIAKSLVELAGSLVILAAAMIVMEGTLPGAAALAVAALGLKFLASAMATMGGMSWSDIGAALVTLAGALLILAVGLTAMMVALPGAAALLVAAPAIGVLAVSLTSFGLVSWGDIGKGIVALIGLFAALAVGGALSPLILILAGALVILGAGIALAGAGMLAAGMGIASFADGMTKLSKIDSQGLQNVSNALDSIIQRIPELAVAVAMGFVDFAQTITDHANTFGDAAAAMIDQMVRVFNQKMPELVAAMFNGLEQMLGTIDAHLPSIVDQGAIMIIGFLNGMAGRMNDIAQAGTNVVVAFLNAMGADIPKVVDAGFQMIIAVMNGIADSIRKNSPQIKAAAGNIGQAIIDGMLGGIGNGQSILDRVGSIASGAISVAKRILDSHSPSKVFIQIGKDVVDGFAIGLTSGSRDKIDSAVSDLMDKLSSGMDSEMQDLQGEQDKLNQLYQDRADNADKLAEAQQKLNEAINNPIKKSTAKKAADRNAANAAAQKSHNDAVRSAQDAVNALVKKQNDYNQSIADESDALGQSRDEYWKLNAARDRLNQLMATEQGRLDDLADQHQALTDQIKDQTAALNDAIKTRDDYNKSITNQYSTEAAINKDTNLSDYVSNLQKQIVDTQQFIMAVNQARMMGLDEKFYKQLLAAGAEDAMPFVQQLLAGGQSAIDDLNNLDATLDKTALVLGTSASQSLYDAGVYAAQGLLQGLQSQDAAIQAEMQNIANYMVTSINNALGIHSPSRVFAEIGSYSAQGLAKGLADSARLISDASAGAGQTAIDSMKKTISGLGDLVAENMDVNPTITPVLDLSSVQKDASTISGLFSGSAFSLGTSYSGAKDALFGYAANQAALTEAMTAQQAAPPVTFVQNNNSPKALSPAEIYRQTNNQLSRAKGALANNARATRST